LPRINFNDPLASQHGNAIAGESAQMARDRCVNHLVIQIPDNVACHHLLPEPGSGAPSAGD
jgi:hypothetical protein